MLEPVFAAAIRPAAAFGVQGLKDYFAVPLAISMVAKRHPFSNIDQCLAAFVQACDIPSSEFFGSGTSFFAESVDRLLEIARLTGSPWGVAGATAVLSDFLEALDELRLGKVPAIVDARNAHRFESVSSAISQVLEKTDKILRYTETNLATQLVSSPAPSPDVSLAHDQRVSRRSQIRTMLDLGQFVSAEAAITLYERDFTLNDDDAFSLATSKLICAHELGRNDEAFMHAKAALLMRPHDARALSNASAIALAGSSVDEALSYAIEMRRTDPTFSVVNFLCALEAAAKQETLDITIASLDLNCADGEVQHAVARVLYNRGQHNLAEDLLRRALSTAEDPDRKELLALNLAALGDFHRLSCTRSRLKEAESLLTEAIEMRRTWQAHKDVHRYRLNRAVVRALRRDYAGAIADCEAVLSDDQDNRHARITKAHALADQGRMLEAWSMISGLPNALEADVALQRGYILAQLGRLAEAVQVITPLCNDSDRHVAAAAAELLVQIAAQMSDTHLFDKILSTIGEAEEKQILRGYWHLRCGEVGLAILALEEVVGSDSDQVDCSVAAVNLARAYVRDGRNEEAITIYEKILTAESDPMLLESYCNVLCRAERYGRAHEVALLILADAPESAVAQEILGAIAERTGDVLTAAEQFEKLANRTGSAEYRLRAAEDFWRVQRLDRVVDLLDGLPDDAFFDDAELLVRYAELEATLDRDASDRAYRAMWLSRSPEAEEAFVRLWAQAQGQRGPFDTITENVAVELIGRNHRMVVVVTDSRFDVGLIDHHSTSSEFGRSLLGRRVGDEFEFAGDRVVIGSISCKKARAHDLVLKESSVRHLERARIRPFNPDEVTDIDAKYFERLIIKRREWLRRYANGECSIGRAAENTNESVVHWWSYAAQVNGVGLAAGSFSDEDVVTLTMVPVVLDLTAALTLAKLGLADVILNSDLRLLSTQSAIDMLLLTQRYELFSCSAPYVASVVDGSFEMRSADQGTYEYVRQIVRDACRILVGCHVVPITYSEGADPVAGSCKEVGRIAADSMIVSRDQNAVLLIDDNVSRGVASKVNVRSAPSQAFLMALKHRQYLSAYQYGCCVVQLNKVGYSFLRVSVEDIYGTWIADGKSVSDPVSRLVAELAKPSCSIDSVLDVASGVLLRLWNSSHDDATTDALVSAVLTATVMDRTTDVLRRLVGRCIERGVGVCLSPRGAKYIRGLRGIQQWTVHLDDVLARYVRGRRRAHR